MQQDFGDRTETKNDTVVVKISDGLSGIFTGGDSGEIQM